MTVAAREEVAVAALRRSVDADELLVADLALDASPSPDLAPSARSLTDETPDDDLDSIFKP